MADAIEVQGKKSTRNEPFEIRFGKYGVLTAEARLTENGNAFSSGSEGYFAGGKIDMGNGDKYQVTCSIVRIGSKPAK